MQSSVGRFLLFLSLFLFLVIHASTASPSIFQRELLWEKRFILLAMISFLVGGILTRSSIPHPLSRGRAIVAWCLGIYGLVCGVYFGIYLDSQTGTQDYLMYRAQSAGFISLCLLFLFARQNPSLKSR